MRTTGAWFPRAGQRSSEDSTNEKQSSRPSAADRYDGLFPGREDRTLSPKESQESGYYPAYESPFRPTKPVEGVTINGIQLSAADLYALLVETQRKKSAGE